jgi:spore coat polysaccharide biosynthesis protein SpsF
MVDGAPGSAMRIIGVVQARFKSTRLPGKVLLPLVADLPVLSVLYERIQSSGIELFLATTRDPSDDITATMGSRIGFKVFRGETENVLSRFNSIAEKANADWIVRLTADNPFVDTEIIQTLVSMAKTVASNKDMVCEDHTLRRYPLGYVPEIVRSSALLRLSHKSLVLEPYHLSHVTSGIESSRRQLMSNRPAVSRQQWRWTIDTELDLMFARKVFEKLGNKWRQATFSDIENILQLEPDIACINSEIRQKSVEDG